MRGRSSPSNQGRHRELRFYAPLAGGVAVLLVAACFFARHSEQLLRWAVRTGYLLLDLGYTVRIVVPNGFRGVLTITEDTEDGQAPVRIGSTFEYRIPHSGMLRTNDAIPLMTWHWTSGLLAAASRASRSTRIRSFIRGSRAARGKQFSMGAKMPSVANISVIKKLS